MNIKYDKILDCLREADTVSVSTGTKYHFLSGESLTVLNRFQYFLLRLLRVDSGASITVDSGGVLAVHKGTIENNGIIVNNGILIND